MHVPVFLWTDDVFAGLFESSSSVGTWLNLNNTSDGGRYWRLISTGSANGGGAGNLLFSHGPSVSSHAGNPLVLTPSSVGIGTVSPETPLHIRSPARNTDLTLESSYGEPDGARARIRLQTPQHHWHIEGDGVGGVFKIRSQTLGADRLAIAPGDGITLYGDVNVSGAITANVKNFEIDHPLDPDNRVLRHASIEAPELMNIYSGNIITDNQGRAEVVLPDYFAALNTDYRYQLTVIDEGDHDEFVLARISRRIEGNRFEIRTSRAHVEVSWQVSGIRQDAYALDNPLIVEDKKP